MKLHLTYVKRTPRTSKAGKPFISLSVKAQEYGESYLGGFGNKDNENWIEGMEVEVDKVEQKGEYLNFEMNRSGVAKASEEVLGKLTKIQLLVEELVADKRKREGGVSEANYPTKESDGLTDETPF